MHAGTGAVWLRALALSSRPKLGPASAHSRLMMPVHVGSRLASSGSPTLSRTPTPTEIVIDKAERTLYPTFDSAAGSAEIFFWFLTIYI